MEDILKKLNAEWVKTTLLKNGDPIEVEVLVKCKSRCASEPNQEVHPSNQDWFLFRYVLFGFLFPERGGQA